MSTFVSSLLLQFYWGVVKLFHLELPWMGIAANNFVSPDCRTLLNCQGPFAVQQVRRIVTDADMLRAFHSTAYSFELYRISWLFMPQVQQGRKGLESFYKEIDCEDEIVSPPSSVRKRLVCQVQILFYFE